MKNEIKYEDLCTASTARDPNSGELKSSDAEFEKEKPKTNQWAPTRPKASEEDKK